VKVKGADGKITVTEELRTGYMRFMCTNSKGVAKFEFVGTNLDGDIKTNHTESGKTLWKLLNGSNTDKTINPED
jgi:filamentous hemagglutinin